jgi:N utilization substance protein A
VVDELRNEKIDIVRWSDDMQRYLASALSPAKVSEVRLNEEERRAVVIVPESQLSLAIGKEGQNVRLAARLTGWRIDICSEEQLRAQAQAARAEEFAAKLAATQTAEQPEAVAPEEEGTPAAEGEEVPSGELAPAVESAERSDPELGAGETASVEVATGGVIPASEDATASEHELTAEPEAEHAQAESALVEQAPADETSETGQEPLAADHKAGPQDRSAPEEQPA